jgi:hypothetical protein
MSFSKVRKIGFLGQDGIVRNRFAGLGQIDEVPNARRQELIHFLAGFGGICVPRGIRRPGIYQG